MTTHRPTRAVLAAVAVAALTTTAAACTPTPTPTPTATTMATASPSSTPTVTVSEQDQNIADAKAAYLAYIAAYDAAAQAGFVNRDLTIAVLDLTSGDAREEIVSLQAAFEQNALAQTGVTVVRSIEATDYNEDTSGMGLHGVKLRACVDLSGVDTVRDGVSTQPADQYTGPRLVYVQMIRQPSGWAVHETDPRPEERC